MDWDLALKLATAIVSTTGLVVGTLFVFVRQLDSKFAQHAKVQTANFESIRTESREQFHSLDKKIHGVEVVVGPYAQEIISLQELGRARDIELTKITEQVNSLLSSFARLERQVEVLQNVKNGR